MEINIQDAKEIRMLRIKSTQHHLFPEVFSETPARQQFVDIFSSLSDKTATYTQSALYFFTQGLEVSSGTPYCSLPIPYIEDPSTSRFFRSFSSCPVDQVIQSIHHDFFVVEQLERKKFHSIDQISNARLLELTRAAFYFNASEKTKEFFRSTLLIRGMHPSTSVQFEFSGIPIDLRVIDHLSQMDIICQSIQKSTSLVEKIHLSWTYADIESRLLDILSNTNPIEQDKIITILLSAWPHRTDLFARCIIMRGIDIKYAQHILQDRLACIQFGHTPTPIHIRQSNMLSIHCDQSLFEAEKIHLLLYQMHHSTQSLAHDDFPDINLSDIYPDGDKDALELACSLWPGYGPLPHYVQSYLSSLSPQTSINCIIETCESFSRTSMGRKNQILTAISDAYLGGSEALYAISLPKFVASCHICCEVKTVHGIPMCKNLKDFHICDTCFHNSMKYSESSLIRDRCPCGCNTFLNRQSFERVLTNLEREIIPRVQRVNIERMQNSGVIWQQCLTANCVFGRDVATATSNNNKEEISKDTRWLKFQCGACERVNFPREHRSSDPVIIENLLQGIFQAKNPKGIGIYRECYHCAAPVIKDTGCMHMVCPCCRGHWDFERGIFSKPRFNPFGVSEQIWRPLRDGILETTGIYKDIPPGILSKTHLTTVQMRAQKHLRDRLQSLPTNASLSSNHTAL